jgi:hypothetical protein
MSYAPAGQKEFTLRTFPYNNYAKIAASLGAVYVAARLYPIGQRTEFYTMNTYFRRRGI